MSDTPQQWQSSYQLRAGDAERQQTIEALNQAWRAGQLTRDEFHDRSQQSLTATYTNELDQLVSDLGGVLAPYQPTTGTVQDKWQSEHEDLLPVVLAPEGTTGSALSVGIMGGSERTGKWVVARNHVAIGFWGGATIDLRDAIFTSEETTITCFGVMGGVEVIVPPELEIEINGIGFMGGFGSDGKSQALPELGRTAGPKVRINGLGFMGGVGITRKRRGEPID